MSNEDTTDPLHFQTRAFLSWLHQHGATISSKVKLADLREHGAGRGVVATAHIAEDEQLFAIPRSLILTAENSSLSSEIRTGLEDPWLSLIAAMLVEFNRATTSKWKSYLDLLPESFDTLMYWNDAELQLLHGSAVQDKIGRQAADEKFSEAVIPKVTPSLTNIAGNDLLAECHRMGSAIMAYGFDLDGPSKEREDNGQEDGWEEDDEDNRCLSKGMVPLADMLNADADRNNAKLFYEDDKVVMKAIKPIQDGEEIFNDYGPLPTADLVRRYGYTTPNYSPYDVTEVDHELLESTARSEIKLSDEAMQTRIDYLYEQDVLDDGYDIGRPGEEQFPPELCIFLNTITAAEADFDTWVKKDKLPKPDLTQDSLGLLYSILVRRRAQYPTNFPNQAPIGISARRHSMATAIIGGEITVLQEAAATILDKQQTSSKRKADTFDEDVQAFRDGSKK